MKQFVLLALLGLLSFRSTETQAIVLRSQSSGRVIASVSDSDSDNQNVHLADNVDHTDEYFAAGDQGMTPLGVEYIRTMPAYRNHQFLLIR